MDEFADAEDGYGFLIESVQYTTGLAASAVPFTTGLAHKQVMEDFRSTATFIGLLRDRGHGRVTLDRDGNTVPWYAVTDELDVRNTHRSLAAQARLHHAAGARRIRIPDQGLRTWQAGEDLDAFVDQLRRIPLRAGGTRLFSTHQMGTCRLGADPATSVADLRGELHDVTGAWIGDGSALPTSPRTNPMITIMAVASRTADHIAQAADVRAKQVQTTPP